MTNPGKVAALVAAATEGRNALSCYDGHESGCYAVDVYPCGACRASKDLSAALAALTPEDVRRADGADEMAKALYNLLNIEGVLAESVDIPYHDMKYQFTKAREALRACGKGEA